MDELSDYIETELFKKIYVLHPIWGIHGKLEKSFYEENFGKKVIVALDRNIFQYLLSAVKNGTFDGEWRKELTSFLIWTMKNNYSVAPYDAIKEQAYLKLDNNSGNKELDLFNYLYDQVSISTIINSFYFDGIRFVGKRYKDTQGEGDVLFVQETSDFYFLYAIMLHFVYEIKGSNQKDVQFKNTITWYMDNCLISGFALTYIIIFFTKEKIESPHNINSIEKEKIINGCKNVAMDLCYIQQLDPNRYPSDEFTLLLATTDKLLKIIFEEYLNANKKSNGDIRLFYSILCAELNEKKKKDYIEFLVERATAHKTINVNPSNALKVARKLAIEEEARLREIL